MALLFKMSPVFRLYALCVSRILKTQVNHLLKPLYYAKLNNLHQIIGSRN